MKHFLKYFAILTVLVSACDTDEFKPADTGIDHYPIRTGYYQVYNVNETVYSEVTAPQTNAFQLRTEIIDSFPNTENGFTYVIHRSTRADESSSWEIKDTWSVRRNDRELVINEGNTAFVKLTFPLKAGSTWNGNKFNDQDEDEYEVRSFDEPFTAGGTTFDRTVNILQEDTDDLIVFLDKREEVYARDVGLIYKETTQLNFCTDNNCIGQQVIKNGRIYKQELIEYGDK